MRPWPMNGRAHDVVLYGCVLFGCGLFVCFCCCRQISKGRGMSNADLNNNPGLLKEESYLRTKGLEGLVNILQNMLRWVDGDREEREIVPGAGQTAVCCSGRSGVVQHERTPMIETNPNVVVYILHRAIGFSVGFKPYIPALLFMQE